MRQINQTGGGIQVREGLQKPALCFSINDLKGWVITLQERRLLVLDFEVSRWLFFAADLLLGA